MNRPLPSGREAPKVSVIMPAYNAATTISFAVASVCAQTETDWELLVIDDGSIDATARIMRELCARDARIRLICGGHNGVSAARNLGIRASSGQVIAFLDADDGWHPDKLAAHLRHLDTSPLVGVSYSQAAMLDEHGHPTGQSSRARTRKLRPEHLLYSNPTTTTSTLVVRRTVFDTVGFFKADMSFAEDLEWLIRASVTSTYKLEGLDQPLTLYRTSPRGLSSQLDQMQEGWETLIEQVKTYAPKIVRTHYRRARAEHLYYLARRALRLPGQAHHSLNLLRAALASDWRLTLRKPLKVTGVFVLAWLWAKRATNRTSNTALRRV